jgi:hypothetical protein
MVPATEASTTDDRFREGECTVWISATCFTGLWWGRQRLRETVLDPAIFDEMLDLEDWGRIKRRAVSRSADGYE